MFRGKTFVRGLLVLFLLAGLLAGALVPTLMSARAAPIQDTPVLHTPIQLVPVQQLVPVCSFTMAQWTFDNLATGANSSPAYSLIASGVASATSSAGSGLTSPTITTTSSNSSPNNWYASGFATGATLNTGDNDYFQFAVDTANYGSVSLSFYALRSNQGPDTMQVYYSTDGTNFNALAGTYSIGTSYPASAFTADLINLTNTSGLTYVRIYGWNSASGDGTAHLDDITLTGCPVVIDSIAPNPTNSDTTVTWHSLENGTYDVRIGGTDCTTGTSIIIGPPPAYTSPATINITIINASQLAEGPNTIRVCVTDASSVIYSAISSIAKDTVAPIVTVDRASGQASPTSTLPIDFSVVFSEPIDVSTFTTADVTQSSGTATGITWSIIDSGDHMNFTLRATAVTGSGTLVPSIDAGKVTDLAGNNNLASTSTDNTVVFNSSSTSTPTSTPTITSTPCPIAYHSLIINEVGWMGTSSQYPGDEWIELYNPSACAIDLTGWELLGLGSSTVTIALTGTVESGGYFVLTKDVGVPVFQNATVNQTSTKLSLLNSGEALWLQSPSPTLLVDTADYSGGAWPAGTTYPYYASMERRGLVADSRTAWVTYAGPITNTPLDRNGNHVRGTPGQANWAWTVTVTPSRTPTKYRSPTPRPPTPFAHVVINEFLPRAGFDWNNDGEVNVYDEFIEIENLGPINVNLQGWKLDNPESPGSSPFALPAKTLKPGERAIYYGSQTHILLLDSGGLVRLINTRGVIVDARSYSAVKYPDQPHCRIPDGEGYWRFPCFPTPGIENVLTGVLPSAPPNKASQLTCQFADTTPEEFQQAECNPFGADIWDRKYWDDQAGEDEFVVPDAFSKWRTIVE